VGRYTTLAPKNTPRLVQIIFLEMREQRILGKNLTESSGVSRRTWDGWRRENGATLASTEAVLNVLGFTCQIPVPVEWLTSTPTVYELLKWREHLTRQMETLNGG